MLASSSPRAPSESEGEDMLDANVMAQDYRAIPELDRYDSSQLDDSEYDHDLDDRAQAERAMRKRDLEERRRTGRLPVALQGMSSDGEDLDETPARKKKRMTMSDTENSDTDGAVQTPTGGTVAEEDENFVNLDDHVGQLEEYLSRDGPRREVRRRFRQFLSDFRDENGHHIYPPLISTMCSENRQSLEVSYLHLSQAVPVLAIWVADLPATLLELFNEEAMAVVQTMFPAYKKVHSDVFVRIKSLPIVDSLRELRQIHLNALIKVSGVVTRRTAVYPQLKMVKFKCTKCGYSMGPFTQPDGKPISINSCISCTSNGPFNLDMEETVYQNYQKITLQEAPGSVPAGRVPRQKEVVLLHDLIDSVSPGEEVEITGVYQHSFDSTVNHAQGFPVFTTVIKANYVDKKGAEDGTFKLTDEDVKDILRLSKKPDIADMIFKSIAPSIWGHEDIKVAMALSMFGGQPKEMEKHRIRGDINVLVLGDPGVAKSQFLKYVEQTAHRAVYTTGKGASAVGLTASVRADPITKEWTLEGGALVLADQGVCLIDEFDKMNDADRTSIHEAMEQQTISISKAGIITTLKARCSVIAAANPVSGRYDSSTTFAENVELSDAILSRFDILSVVRDTVDEETDARLANFVVDNHITGHPDHDEEEEEEGGEESKSSASSTAVVAAPISQEMLKKYIMYARRHCHPQLQNIDEDRIAQLYIELRRESMSSGGIPIAIRHIESIIRMSEAHAKMHLREHVVEDDVNMAIRVMLESFIGTQKYSVMKSLREHFKKYITFKKDTFGLLLFVLKNMVKDARAMRKLRSRRQGAGGAEEEEEPVEVPVDEFVSKARELQISNLTAFYKSRQFMGSGFEFDRARKVIVKSF